MPNDPHPLAPVTPPAAPAPVQLANSTDAVAIAALERVFHGVTQMRVEEDKTERLSIEKKHTLAMKRETNEHSSRQGVVLAVLVLGGGTALGCFLTNNVAVGASVASGAMGYLIGTLTGRRPAAPDEE